MVKTQNVDTALLDQKIKESGLKIGYICNQLGVSRQAFDKKRKGIDSFRLSEVYVICDLLNIVDNAEKTKIFLYEC